MKSESHPIKDGSGSPISSGEFDPDLDHEELPLSIATLANLTGINTNHLQRMYDGDVAPHFAHIERIESVVGAKVAKLFDRHTVSKPDFTTTKVGSVPENHTIMTVPAAKLEVDDLIAYDRPDSNGRIVRSVNSWVGVKSKVIDGERFVSITLEGDVEMSALMFALVQIARPN